MKNINIITDLQYGKNKIYIMELSAPSSDAMFPINAGNLNNEESKSERRSVHGNPKKNEILG